MNATSYVPVEFRTENLSFAIAVLTECPVCLALVREVSLDEHKLKAHGEES